MNKKKLGILLLFALGLAGAGNYTFDYQVTGLQAGDFGGTNASNYSGSYIFPFTPQEAVSGNYTATSGIEILGIALPSGISAAICSIGNMTLSGLQTIQNQYSAITSPFTIALTYIFGIIFLLGGIILIWHYALKNVPGWPRIVLPRIRF